MIFLFYSLEGASIIPNSSRPCPRIDSHLSIIFLSHIWHVCAFSPWGHEIFKACHYSWNVADSRDFLIWRINGFIKLGIQFFVCFFSKMIDSDLAGLWTICFLCLPCTANHTQSSFLDLSRFPVLIPFSSYSHLSLFEINSSCLETLWNNNWEDPSSFISFCWIT